MFTPSAHVAGVPFSTSVPPFRIVITVFSSFAVAVTVLVLLVVVAVYSVTSAENDGESVSEPIVSPDRSAFKGFLSPY